jgi:hypothetical protein
MNESPKPQIIENTHRPIVAEPLITGSTLEGPRQTGTVVDARGQVTEHRISGDGMKYTRVVSNGNRSAADFHREAGVAQPYELRGVASDRPEGLVHRVAKTAGRALLDAARLSRP